MDCKLCGSNPAIKNSHIVPEFLYKPIYDVKHRFYQISTDPHKPESIHQKGLKEELLCIGCEAKLSRWENYASKVIFGGAGFVATASNALYFKGINYATFRLFLHSMIWRMSVSSNRWFREVDLGKNEEIYRNFLVKSDPGPDHQFWAGMVRVLIDGMDVNLFHEPEKIRFGGKTYYRTLLCGTLFSFSTSKNNRGLPGFSLTPNGEMVIPKKEARDIPYLKQILFDLDRASNDRPKQFKRL